MAISVFIVDDHYMVIEGIRSLLQNDKNIEWALKFSPEKAEPALNELSGLSNIFALTAKTTLKLWKEGKLNLL
jgi:DNA-binding NarL/FixJ family response regulator